MPTHTSLPNPIKQIRRTKISTTKRELIGVNVPLLTAAIHLDNGKPLSRALQACEPAISQSYAQIELQGAWSNTYNAKTCRDVDAMKFVTLSMIRTTMIAASATAPLAEPVAVVNCARNG